MADAPSTLRDLRAAAKLTQADAAQQIHLATDGAVPRDRRHVINAETGGSDSLALLEGMALVYGVTFEAVRQANRATVYASRNSVPK